MIFRGSMSIFNLFYLCEKCNWNSDRNCIESVKYFGSRGHLNAIASSTLGGHRSSAEEWGRSGGGVGRSHAAQGQGSGSSRRGGDTQDGQSC